MTLKDISNKYNIPYYDLYMKFMDSKEKLLNNDMLELNKSKETYDVNDAGVKLLIKDFDTTEKGMQKNFGIPNFVIENSKSLNKKHNITVFKKFIEENGGYDVLRNKDAILEFLKIGNRQSHTISKKILMEYFKNVFKEEYDKRLMKKYVSTIPMRRTEPSNFYYLEIDGEYYVNKYSTISMKYVLPNYVRTIGIYDMLKDVYFREDNFDVHYMYNIPIIKISDFFKYYIPEMKNDFFLQSIDKIIAKENINIKEKLNNDNEIEHKHNDVKKYDDYYEHDKVVNVKKEAKKFVENKDIGTKSNIFDRLDTIENYLERILDLLGGNKY